MVNIDKIMDMFDWNNPPEVQEEGRRLAKEVRCINAFIQPGHLGHIKNVWDNCALVLAERSDTELRPYVGDLFHWLIDMNWPGAECIWDRLMRYKDRKWLDYMLNECIKEAKALKEDIWLNVLLDFRKQY